MKSPRLVLAKYGIFTLLALALASSVSSSLSAAALIYYDGTGSGSTVTNLGTLGTAGNGTIQTVGLGTVGFQTSGGPGGVSDPYLTFTNAANTSGGWVNVPTASLPSFQNTSWSVSGSFNRDATSANVDTVVHFGNGDYFGQENDLGFYVQGGAGATTATAVSHFPDDVSITSATVSTNAWHSYAFVFQASGSNDGAGVLQLYIDGTLRGSDSTFSLALGGTPVGLAQVLQWGGIQAGNTDRGFTGGLDNFAFYNFALTASDVTGLNNGTLTPLTVVPEPSRVLLIFGGLLTFAARRKRSC